MKILSTDELKSWLDISKERICELEINRKNYRHREMNMLYTLNLPNVICRLYLSKGWKNFLKKPKIEKKKYKSDVKIYEGGWPVG